MFADTAAEFTAVGTATTSSSAGVFPSGDTQAESTRTTASSFSREPPHAVEAFQGSQNSHKFLPSDWQRMELQSV